MTPRQLLERIRDSLLYVPAAFIAASLLLAWVANRLDDAMNTEDVLYLLPTSISAARNVLGTVAGATITVAALVFSITAVSVQLSATQYSPRVLQGFLRDRFQQIVVGLVMGTFTYSLVSLATAGTAGRSPEVVDASWAATIGLALGVVSALAIVAFIDHVTRRIRVDDTIRRLTALTAESLRATFAEPTESALPNEGWRVDSKATPVRAVAGHSGWAQEIRPRELLGALPPGAIARLDVKVGDYVVRGDPILTVWPPEHIGDHELEIDHLGRKATLIGEGRTIQQDPAFGLRQLVDIALRALSPGINDPATAADVVRHLVEPMRAAASPHNRHRIYRSDSGTRVIARTQRDGGDYVHLAFGEIRLAAADQPLVLLALVESLGKLQRDREEDAGGSDVANAIDVELELIHESAVASTAMTETDRKPILAALRSLGIPSRTEEEGATVSR